MKPEDMLLAQDNSEMAHKKETVTTVLCLRNTKLNLFMNSCLAQSAIYSVKLTFLCRMEFHFPGNMLTAKMPAYMLQYLSHACQVKRENGYDYTN